MHCSTLRLLLWLGVLPAACGQPDGPAETSRPEGPTSDEAPPQAEPERSETYGTSSTTEGPERQLRETPADALGLMPDGVGLEVGQPAPDARLENADGEAVQLADLRSRGPLLIVFYRGGWCPYCNLQIRDLVEAYHEYRRRGVTPVAISVDRPEEAARTRATYEIPFPVLSDPGLAAHEAFRVGRTVPPEELARLREFGMDLEAASGRDHHVIAIPSIFFVDREGVIRWAHADPDYRTRPSNRQVLEAIDRRFE
jgi:peroxiredoxin